MHVSINSGMNASRWDGIAHPEMVELTDDQILSRYENKLCIIMFKDMFTIFSSIFLTTVKLSPRDWNWYFLVHILPSNVSDGGQNPQSKVYLKHIWGLSILSLTNQMSTHQSYGLFVMKFPLGVIIPPLQLREILSRETQRGSFAQKDSWLERYPCWLTQTAEASY